MQFEVEVAAGFTGPVELADGRLFALDADLKALYSTDGRAWGCAGSDEVPLFEVGAPGVRLKPMSLIRLASGGLIMNYWEPVSRSTGMREFRTCVCWFRDDGGLHWEQGRFNDLVSSRSEIWIDRLPDSGNLLCVWNQVSEAEIQSGYYRSRLSSAISSDSGVTWGQFRTIVQTVGMATVDRLEPGEPALPLSSGVSPDRGPYPPGGHYTYRHPRVRFIGDHAYLRVDARCYDAPGSRVRYGDRLWVMPVGWFDGED